MDIVLPQVNELPHAGIFHHTLCYTKYTYNFASIPSHGFIIKCMTPQIAENIQ